MKIVALTAGERLPQVWTDEWIDALRRIGEFELIEMGGAMDDAEAAAVLRAHDVAIVGWDARVLPEELATDPGRLRYVCSYSGTIRHTVPRSIVEAGIPVSNWGDLPAPGVAEGAMTLLLSVAHQLPLAIGAQRSGEWGFDGTLTTGVRGLAVGVYGCGVIGRRFLRMLEPFGARVQVHDPYADDLPDGVERAESLDDLCRWSEALVIHSGLNAETERSLGAAQLALLRDHAIVVNTARGAIVDQDSLAAELVSGRLRAGLDVLEPDQLAADHPLRRLDNVVLTFHQVSDSSWPSRPVEPRAERVLEQLARYSRGETPLWLFDLDRYDRST